MSKNIISSDESDFESSALHKSAEKAECPICCSMICVDKIEEHANSCIDSISDNASPKDSMFSSRDLFNSDIFENDIDQNDESSKRKSWNLENSFENSESNPSKRKRIAHKPSTTSLMQSEPIDLAPYPDLKKGNVRGCLRNDSNNPGLSVQNLLKGKQPVKQSSLNVQERGSFETERTSNSFGFKLHPFLAKTNSPVNEAGRSGQTVGNAIVPDGEGGFIINDSAIHKKCTDEEQIFPSSSLLSGGFIDFKNQFKEKAVPRTPVRARKQKKSPKKKRTWKPSGRSRGKGRGRGVGRFRHG